MKIRADQVKPGDTIIRNQRMTVQRLLVLEAREAKFGTASRYAFVIGPSEDIIGWFTAGALIEVETKG